MNADKQTKVGFATLVLLLTVAVASLIAMMFLGPGSSYPVATAVLSGITVLVGVGIGAVLNIMQKDRKEGKRNSPATIASRWSVFGLLIVAGIAMWTLALNFSPGELQKTALGGLIILAGAAVTRILNKRDSDDLRKELIDEVRATKREE